MQPAEPTLPALSLSFLGAGGMMGEAVRGHDWSASPLGPIADWPQSLKTAVGIMLSSKFPMFLAWGPELTFLYNDSYVDILGAKHPALGEPFEQIWFEIWDDISPIVSQALAGEATYWENLPLTMTRKGYEEQTWFTFSYSPLRGDGGAVEGMFCACTETTATVLAERRRETEMERLRTLFDRAPVFIAVLAGPDHVFEIANASYLRLVGERDVIGKTVRDALPDVSGQGFFELLDQVYSSGEPYTGHSTRVSLARASDGASEQRLVDFVYQPTREADGSVSGIFVAGYDVTEQRLVQLKLRESEERFRLIADSAPVPMWVSKPDRTRSFVNKAYVDFVGLSYEEAAALDWRTILHPDDHDRIVAESIAGEASLQPFNLEARYRGRNGEWRWIRSTSQPRWGPDGEVEGFIGVAHDVTEAKEAEAALEGRVEERTRDLLDALERVRQEVAERERAEEALRQSQKMEAVGQLTGGIAHDFNNLLTPIIGGLEMIVRRLEEPRLQRLAQAALDSGRRGAKLATQLLAFSRLQRLSMTSVDVNKLIADLRSILQHTIGPNIAVETMLADDAGHALCDTNQLENAVLNLAINARDAMAEGGTLTITTGRHREATGSDLAAGDYACIAVSDTGRGMAPHVLARATEPFFSTKPVGKGTGLGLSQVYGIAKQAGGTVRIESEEGRGTTIRILLPHVPEAQGEAVSPASETPGLAACRVTGCRILVVDDDPEVRNFLADALGELGHEVETVAGAEEALRRLGNGAPDLMLVDFAMPGCNGAELARQVRDRRPEQRIIFVTGYAESGQIEAALGSDAPVLRKPFSMDELAAAIGDQLDAQAG
ncbi:PAS domain-containing sensor histidine kinase [Sphingosinicella sp. YJ22]|uniref:hybrid sensor histidine kinase/response regulator n=1 Tax=Sphingosinicella sp. YJ22 TaxID=1104780 RepID=UPI0014094BF6|nr:PAS domain-containing sensor histidine kinase [Sphingosinicella sp. YJ22]